MRDPLINPLKREPCEMTWAISQGYIQFPLSLFAVNQTCAVDLTLTGMAFPSPINIPSSNPEISKTLLYSMCYMEIADILFPLSMQRDAKFNNCVDSTPHSFPPKGSHPFSAPCIQPGLTQTHPVLFSRSRGER